MEVLVYLVPLALTLGLLGLGAFLWSLKTGQYDDVEGAAWRAIIDDDAPVAAADRPVDSRSNAAIRAKAPSAEH
jgi:cbb3-type cytochrome oxidase maturation protein